MTSREVEGITGWHHGRVSGYLSGLHRKKVISRLAEKSNGYRVYVLPEYVAGRKTQPYGRKSALKPWRNSQGQLARGTVIAVEDDSYVCLDPFRNVFTGADGKVSLGDILTRAKDRGARVYIAFQPQGNI